MKRGSPHADAWQIVRELAPTVAIVHHIAGRIRLKLNAGLPVFADGRQPTLDEVRAAVEAMNGIRSVRINLLARSCTVEYDEKAIPPTAWNDLLNGTESPAADALVGALRARYEDWRS